MVMNLGKLIMGFVFILVGIILLGITADSIFGNNNLFESVNETVAIGLRTGQLANDDVTSMTNFNNITDDLTSSIGTDVNFTRPGVVTINNATIPPARNFNATYNYEGDLYVRDATSRNLLDLVPLFFSIAVLAAGIALVLAGGLLDLMKRQ